MKIRNALMLSLLLPLMAACSKTETPEAPVATAPVVAEPVVATAAAAPAQDVAATEPAPPNNNPIVPPKGPAPVAGTVKSVNVAMGEQVPASRVVAEIEMDGGAA